jgi:hypothetical protein
MSESIQEVPKEAHIEAPVVAEPAEKKPEEKKQEEKKLTS